LWSIRRVSDGYFALDFSADVFGAGATIECGDSAGLFDESRRYRLEFSDGDDFSWRHDLGHGGRYRNVATSGQADRQQG
jgi:hypothetical protein